jgi:hypothetical protein
MGRGLSDLQKEILTLAFDKVRDERREDNYPHRPDLYAREVLVTVYGLDANFYSLSEDDQYCRIDKPVRERRGWVFERERYDAYCVPVPGNEGRLKLDDYNKALAATIRAFARLEKRGLVKRQRRSGDYSAGITLTPAGYQTAKSLISQTF